jgi:hypothetical protein
MGEGCYVLDNAAEARARFEALPRIYDPGTFRHLAALGVGEGWRCLEVGAGGGSVARWLADRVGPVGHVLATDIDTRFLDALAGPTLEVRRHDVTAHPCLRRPLIWPTRVSCWATCPPARRPSGAWSGRSGPAGGCCWRNSTPCRCRRIRR